MKNNSSFMKRREGILLNIRQGQILEILKQKKAISIDHLSSVLSYSHSTIRRDLIILEEMGLVQREKGFVRLILTNTKEKHFKLRNKEHIPEKNAICNLVKDFLTDGMSLFLDSSSTVLQLCPLLAKYKNITVVTNGVEIAYELMHNSSVELFITGGYTREGSSGIVGESAIDYIKQFNLDLCVLSCNGFDEKGFYEPSMQQALVKKQMLENAKITLMLCDSSKIHTQYKFHLTSYKELDYLLIEQTPPKTILDAASNGDCEIIHP